MFNSVVSCIIWWCQKGTYFRYRLLHDEYLSKTTFSFVVILCWTCKLCHFIFLRSYQISLCPWTFWCRTHIASWYYFRKPAHHTFNHRSNRSRSDVTKSFIFDLKVSAKVSSYSYQFKRWRHILLHNQVELTLILWLMQLLVWEPM
jgi:hypothetical protein